MARTPKGRVSTNMQKPYSDDKNKGRRTGKTVKEGHRDSDGWEDFEDMWRLNDASPRPVKQIPQTPRKSYTRDFDPDDSFDMSIVQDEDDGPNPSAYAASIPRPAPSSALHLSSLSRRVDTTRSIDFDAIPSPGKTSGLVRSSHSHSLRADLDISRSKMGERPKPKPSLKPRIPDRPGGPEPDETENEELAPNIAVTQPSSPSSRYRGNASVSKNARKPNPKLSSSNAQEPSQEDSEPDSEELEAPVRATSQASAAGRSKFQPAQTARRGRSSDSDPDRAKNDRRSVSLGSEEDNSGPEDDFQGPYNHDDGLAPMDTDFGFDAHQQDEAYNDDAPVDADVEPFADQTNLGADEDQREQVHRVEQKTASVKKKKRKSKDTSTSRGNRTELSPVVEEDENMEPYIAVGLQAVDGQDSDEEAREPDPKPRPKKARTTKSVKNSQSKRRGTTAPSEGHVTMGDTGSGEESHGVRRSTRRRHKPLEYWRGERIILGRSEDGPALCPVFKGFLEIPKEIPDPLGTKQRKRSRTARSTSRGPRATSSRRNTEEPENVPPESQNPEAGWDDDTPVDGDVMDFVTQQELHRRLAFTAKHIDPEPAVGGAFAFKKLFGDDDFIASGVITFPVGGKKPMKGTKDNTYVFFVHSGAIEVTIHHDVLTLTTGGTFIVPRGNQYEIRNIAQRETVLFFAQARKVPIEDDENVDGTQTAGSAAPSVGLRRSASSAPQHSAGPPRSPAPAMLQQFSRQQQQPTFKTTPAAYRMSTDSPSKARPSPTSPVKLNKSKLHSSTARVRHR